jgi:hypothetical protein
VGVVFLTTPFVGQNESPPILKPKLHINVDEDAHFIIYRPTSLLRRALQRELWLLIQLILRHCVINDW